MKAGGESNSPVMETKQNQYCLSELSNDEEIISKHVAASWQPNRGPPSTIEERRLLKLQRKLQKNVAG